MDNAKSSDHHSPDTSSSVAQVMSLDEQYEALERYEESRRFLLGEIRFLSWFVALSAVGVLFLFLLYRSVWIPLVLGLLAAYIVDPVVAFFSSHTKLPRRGVILGAIGALTMIVLGVCVVLLPTVKSQAMEIIKVLPDTYLIMIEIATPYIEAIHSRLYAIGVVDESEVSLAALSEVFSPEQIGSAARNTLSTVWSSLPGIISFVVGVALVPCIMYLGLHYAPQIQKGVYELAPPHQAEALKDLFLRLSRTLRAVIVGQLYVAMALGVLYGFGYSILGFKGAIAIGLAAGVGRLVPYMDMVVAFVLSFAVIMASDGSPWSPLLGSVLVIVIVSIIDTAIVTPKLIGSSAGVHPIIVICSIISFSALLGFWGVVVAVPVIALLKELFCVVWEYYKKWSQLRDGKPVISDYLTSYPSTSSPTEPDDEGYNDRDDLGVAPLPF